ncbi:MAG TPA: hypothetical protein VKQ72_03810 [Aggregatilineales bacterium]|nr:hypothetical protein [Aggregatilineales bacterium]
MRISIWQQFSSNHSGAYYVVGNFQSVEAARNAYDELRRIVSEIYKWLRENPEEIETTQKSSQNGLLPPEIAFAQQYDVEWPQTIDWMEIEKAVRIVGTLVVVSNPDQTWMTRQPFQGLLERLGGQTVGYDLNTDIPNDIAFHLYPTIRFTAPNSSAADKIELAFRTYITGDLTSPENLPPWHNDEANYRKVVDHSRLLRREYVEILQRNWQREYESCIKLRQPRAQLLPLQRLALHYPSVKFTRDNLKFTFAGYTFHNQELGLSALLAYLEANVCTDIEFRFAE